MAIEEFTIPAYVSQYLSSEGYMVNTAMDPFIQNWWMWYTGTDEWYKREYVTTNNMRKTRDRLSLRPARRVCREWASLLLNEQTTINTESERSNAWLNGDDDEKGYLTKCNFWEISQELVEEAFALGTAAWALWFDVRPDTTETVIKPRTYDARMVKPLTWDDDGVTECAFCTRTYMDGKPADQLQMHYVGENGNYWIRTVIWVDGKQVDLESQGVMDEFDTGCDTPTFAIVRPGIKNTCVDISPYGQSVFADALDAVKGVDICWDAMMQEVELTEPMVFMDESMIDVRDVNGKAVPVPRGPENRLFRKLLGKTANDLYEVFSPDIRIEPLHNALNVALAELGDQCGFGQNYFTLDKGGGMRTATEVSADNSTLMRSIKKHEVALSCAIQQLVTAILKCARIHCAADVEDEFGDIDVFFDDSIITDTQTDKAMMLNEIAAGVVPKWMYLTTFYGMAEDEARASLETSVALPEGF